MEEAKRIYNYLIEVQRVIEDEKLKKSMSVVVRYYLSQLKRLKFITVHLVLGELIVWTY